MMAFMNVAVFEVPVNEVRTHAAPDEEKRSKS
jgi:hypothetical protein